MSEVYESRKVLAEYLLFHFGKDDEILPADGGHPAPMRDALGFPRRTVAHFEDTLVTSGLDLGCAVGRSTFEMARHCRQVVGLDFSHNFIAVAERLRCGERVAYERLEQGHQHTPLLAGMPDGIDAARVSFRQGDAMNLAEDFGPFERVHAANLLCRLPQPQKLLQRLPSLVAAGGELVLATPCTWLAEFTPPQHWPQGDTLDWLQRALAGAFTLCRRTEEPFLIRETARKFQWSSSLVTVWRRH